MSNLNRLVSTLVFEHLNDEERVYLSGVFERCSGFPNLQQLWKLVDEPWHALNCDPSQLDDRVSAFYNHPVWLLNGLFTEQDAQSIAQRQVFTHWVTEQRPSRVADYGGGFGSLARMIGSALPETEVHIVEPHAHPAAIARASDSPNVRYVQNLSGEYDLLIATDVFEHVPDPVGLAISTASSLRIGGKYIIANCFRPVVACHLPQHFHFLNSWVDIMKAAGLAPEHKLGYGHLYVRNEFLDERAARRLEQVSKQIYPYSLMVPFASHKIGRVLFNIFS